MSNDAERFEKYFTMTDGCWLWGGTIMRDGYGFYRGTTAHRWSYLTYVGPISGGLEIDHLCRNRPCVNPAHLEPVTHLENMRRRSLAQTHCKRGHEYNAANTYVDKQGWRSCRRCNAESAREYRARRSQPQAARVAQLEARRTA